MRRPARARRGLRLLLAMVCAVVAVVVPDASVHAQPAAREGQFKARWVVNGTWRGIGLGGTREVIFADLGGRLDVTHGSGQIVDLATRCLVLWDSEKGGSGRCRWSHPSGDEIFVEVEGGLLANATPVSGRLVGGTGRYTGIAGEFAFREWSSLHLDREERSIESGESSDRPLTAFTQDLTGSWRAP